jgi:cysteinylglycine-S-conjugate dipeptidase
MAVAEAIERQLAVTEELIGIPSVSLPGFDRDYVRESAEVTREALARIGLENVAVLSAADGQPAVVGERIVDPALPTVLLYAHHDVMPADADEWTSSPFVARVRDGRLYGRGAADDKGGLAVHLAALDHLGDDLGVNVRVLVEGEEEAGSPTIAALFEAYPDRLRADLAIVTDGLNDGPLAPTLAISARGMLDLELTVATGSRGAHSGTWGGAAPDALLVLARVLASLHDSDGDVAVAGLRTAPEPSGAIEPAVVAEAVGLLDGVREIGTGSVAARLWARPAITTIGVDAPSIAESSNRLVGGARARLNVRLAPGDEPGSALVALQEHLEAAVPFGAQWELTVRGSGEPFAYAGREDILTFVTDRLGVAFGRPCVTVGCGASIPVLARLQRHTAWNTVLVTAVADPQSNPHGEDESVDLEALRRAVSAEVAVLTDLRDDHPTL